MFGHSPAGQYPGKGWNRHCCNELWLSTSGYPLQTPRTPLKLQGDANTWRSWSKEEREEEEEEEQDGGEKKEQEQEDKSQIVKPSSKPVTVRGSR
eukprot:762670-Hanusia_phi.AAC.2